MSVRQISKPLAKVIDALLSFSPGQYRHQIGQLNYQGFCFSRTKRKLVVGACGCTGSLLNGSRHHRWRHRSRQPQSLSRHRLLGPVRYIDLGARNRTSGLSEAGACRCLTEHDDRECDQ